MSWEQAIYWYALAAIGILGSAMFSGLETGTYTLNRVRLHVLAHAPRSNAAVLDRLLRSPNRLLGTLLVGNNVANYLSSLAIAALLGGAGYGDWAQVGINAAILTPLLFIFGEVLPKDLFRSHTDRLTYYFARPLLYLQQLLIYSGALPLIDLVSHGLQRIVHGAEMPLGVLHPRRVVTQLMRESAGHGVISLYQSDMVDRVLQLEQLRVRDVMVPWSEVVAARVSQPPEAIWALADRFPYARLPLLDGQGQPVGILELFDVLRHDPQTCPPLQQLAQPIVRLAPSVSCRTGLVTLQRRYSSMGIVYENRHRPVGLVTLKDLVEPIVGELDVW